MKKQRDLLGSLSLMHVYVSCARSPQNSGGNILFLYIGNAGSRSLSVHIKGETVKASHPNSR